MYLFSDVYGQDDVKHHLMKSIASGKMSHAYIFNGEKGSGRLEMARALAAALMCSEPKITEDMICPCGKCQACLQIETLSHPDVILVLPSGKSLTLGVDDIRKMRSDVQIKPYMSDRKIYIVPDAEKMTIPAQNALLKTLEEPPAYAVIILLSNGLKTFLPTVLSRSIVMQFHPVDTGVLQKLLVKDKQIPQEEAYVCAALSHGNAGRAVELATDKEMLQVRRLTVDFLKTLPSQNSRSILAFAEAAAIKPGKKGNDPGPDEMPAGHVDDIYDIAFSWFRDLLTAKSTKDAENLIFRNEVKYIKNAADRLSYESLGSIREAFETAFIRRSTGGNEVQIMEMLLLTIRSVLQEGR